MNTTITIQTFKFNYSMELLESHKNVVTHKVGGIVHRYNHEIKQKYHFMVINAVLITGENTIKSP